MKSFKRMLAAACLTAGCLCPAVFAQSHRMALSLQAGGAGHEENNLNVGLAAGVGMAVPLSPRLSLAFEADFWDTRSQTSYRKLYNGRLRVRPFLLGLRYEFRGNGYFTPYAVAGAGYVETKFRIGTLPVVPDTAISQSVRSGWAGYFGAGIVWRLSGFWDFFTEVDYLIRTAPGQTYVESAGLGGTTDDIWINLHVVYLKLGFRFLL
jgi:opacity protein-like surface antigen